MTMANDDKSDTWENALLLLIFNNIAFTGLGDATGLRATLVAGNLYVALHTADPGEVGSQATNETTYQGYLRAAVPRSALGWTVTGNAVVNAADVEFPVCTGAPFDAITHFSVGIASAGATTLLYKGSCGPGTVLLNNLPRFPAGTLGGSEA
jgi:hypothetical protein